MLPAVGQGFLAIECREDDAETRTLVSLTEDSDARRAAEVERAYLAAMGGFCKTPLAGYATVTEDGRLSVEVLVASLDGTHLIRERLQTPVDAPAQETGDRLKQAVFAQGAEAIIAQEEGLLS
jgi:hydroxymethylbilane synthase